MEEKLKLRAKLSKQRASLNKPQVQAHSSKIIKNLIGCVNWEEVRVINVYQTIKQNNEVDVSGLLDFLKQNYPAMQIEVTESKISPPQNIPAGKSYDLAIVPLLGFDRSGNRLGYGGGYYDRFLASNNCKQVIGLAYSLQEIENLPVEEHDQKLDLIITEKEIIKP